MAKGMKRTLPSAVDDAPSAGEFGSESQTLYPSQLARDPISHPKEVHNRNRDIKRLKLRLTCTSRLSYALVVGSIELCVHVQNVLWSPAHQASPRIRSQSTWVNKPACQAIISLLG